MRFAALDRAFAYLGLAIGGLGWICAAAEAGVVVQHTGDVDPQATGWSIEGSGYGLAAGPAYDDGGFSSWFVVDRSQAPGSSLAYVNTSSDPFTTLGTSLGWILRAEVRLADVPDAIGDAGSSVVEYSNGQRAYRMALGTQDDGDPLVLLSDGGLVGGAATGLLVAADGIGPGYHTYELRYRPGTGLADLWIDGQQRATGYGGVASSSSHVAFGSTSESDTGAGMWHRVEWEVRPVPEPSGMALGVCGLSLLLAAVSLRHAFAFSRIATRSPRP